MGALGKARKVLEENAMVFKVGTRKKGKQGRLKEMGDVRIE